MRGLRRFVQFLVPVILLFFAGIVFGGRGYFFGDYLRQFYPWAFYLHKSLTAFSLPVWAPEIGSGFPLLAEGQIAAFYPVNLILAFLPFPFSYHASFLVLFFLAGLFMYFFCAEIGISAYGRRLAALVFLFGSAYAGLFYGFVSLRVFLWFPFCLLFASKLAKDAELRWALSLSLGWAAAWLGGNPQLVLYMILMAAAFLLMTAQDPLKAFMLYLFSAAAGAALAACQLFPTWELIGFSSREGLSLNQALQNSLNPLSVSTLLWPSFGAFLRLDFYVGLVPLFLAILSIRELRSSRWTGALWVMAFLAVFLALGRYNPLYVLALKISGLTFFRAPVKFMFFAAFALSVLAAMGLDAFFRDASGEKRFKSLAKKTFFLSLAVFAAAFALARLFKEQILYWAERYVSAYVLGKPGHAGTFEHYRQKIEGFYALLLERTELSSPWVLMTLLTWGVVFAAIFFGKDLWTRKKPFVFFVLGASILDLLLFSFCGTGFRGNELPRRTAEDITAPAHLKESPGLFRVYEFPSEEPSENTKWLPNANMLFGYSSVGIYTPLALKSYRDVLAGLGAVDDSSGIQAPTKQELQERKELLGLLNVRYVLTRRSLEGLEGFSRVAGEAPSDLLYEIKNYSPRAFLTEAAVLDETQKTALLDRGAPELSGGVEVVSYAPREVKLNVDAPAEVFLFLSDTYYPGWKAFVDGSPAVLYRAQHAFRGLRMEAGKHSVIFSYQPQSLVSGIAVSLISLLTVLALLWRANRRNV